MACEIKQFERDTAEKKNDKRSSSLSCTLVENMREQPKAAGFIYSPRRPGKSVVNDVENSNKSKSTKLAVTKSSDSSPNTKLSFDGRHKRKSLQVLQPSADGQKLLFGGSDRKTKNKKHLKEPSRSRSKQAKLRVSKIREETDSPSSSSELERGSTTSDDPTLPTSSDEAYALMVQEPAPEKYWEMVAEERRKALEETLEENMKLYQIIEDLKAENEALREKASHTDYYATMYKITQDLDSKPEEKQDV